MGTVPALRPIIAYYDVARRQLVSDSMAGLRTADYPYLTLGESAVLLLTLRNTDGTAYAGYSTMVRFYATIKQGYDPVTPPTLLVEADNDVINVSGDWLGDDADLSSGQISIRLDGDKQAIADLLGTEDSVSDGVTLQLEGYGLDLYLEPVLTGVIHVPWNFINNHNWGLAVPTPTPTPPL